MSICLKKLFEDDFTEIIRIYLIEINGKCEIDSFIDYLNQNRINDFKKLITHLRRISEYGIKNDPTKFKYLNNKKPLCEVKISGVRVYCVRENNRLFLLIGDFKNSQKWKSSNKNAADKALSLYEIYLDAKKNNRLRIEE